MESIDNSASLECEVSSDERRRRLASVALAAAVLDRSASRAVREYADAAFTNPGELKQRAAKAIGEGCPAIERYLHLF